MIRNVNKYGLLPEGEDAYKSKPKFSAGFFISLLNPVILLIIRLLENQTKEIPSDRSWKGYETISFVPESIRAVMLIIAVGLFIGAVLMRYQCRIACKDSIALLIVINIIFGFVNILIIYMR